MSEPLDDPALKRLAMRLAIPERAPDDHFVERVDYALRAKALVQGSDRERREQLLIELGAGGALLLAVQQLSTVGEQAVVLITPAATSFGGLSLAAVALSLLIALFTTAERERTA